LGLYEQDSSGSGKIERTLTCVKEIMSLAFEIEYERQN
jgi:hypothetical protein